MKAAVFIDEMNAIKQFQMSGFKGPTRWRFFLDQVLRILHFEYPEITCDFHLYGAIPEDTQTKSNNRRSYFKSLQIDGIQTHEGICYVNEDTGLYQEKGVDTLLALDLMDHARNKYDLLIVFSGDADIVPAVARAKAYTKIMAILDNNAPAMHMRKNVDGVFSLAALIQLMSPDQLLAL